MAQEKIGEEINVIASFAKNKLCPHVFKWKNKRYNVSNINLVHKARDGEADIYYFAVSTPAGFYKISFNNKTFSWMLDEYWQ